MSFTVLGTGRKLPDTVVTHDDLATFLDTSYEWLTTRTCIHRRHVLKQENLIDLATVAAKNALENSGVTADELD